MVHRRPAVTQLLWIDCFLGSRRYKGIVSFSSNGVLDEREIRIKDGSREEDYEKRKKSIKWKKEWKRKFLDLFGVEELDDGTGRTV